jgi:hypothetical protein
MGGDLAAMAALRRVLLKVGLKARTAGPVLAPVSYGPSSESTRFI